MWFHILLLSPYITTNPIPTLIPTLGAARFDARGELRLAERLKDCLEDNAWVWHNIPGGQYDAVLIDEAHDFEPQWLALAAKRESDESLVARFTFVEVV